MRQLGKKITALLMTLILITGLLPGVSLADSTSGSVTVRIIGQNNEIINQDIDISTITDHTTDPNDSSTGLNALDAVICATQTTTPSAFDISFNSTYGTYYIKTLANITPAGSDYWGTLATSATGTYDSNALSGHGVTAGDTYVVYYDKYTGGSLNYGYQSYAWFTTKSDSAKTGVPLTIGAKTIAYDASYNTIEAVLPNTTIYATGGPYATATAVGVTDDSGLAHITFRAAGTYNLSFSSDYTYSKCEVNVSGTSVTLSELNVSVTNGTDSLSHSSLKITDNSGKTYSPYSVNSGNYKYNVPNATYNYSAAASGYKTSNGTLNVSADTTKNLTLSVLDGYPVTITPGDTNHETVIVNSGTVEQTAVSVVGGVYIYDLQNGVYTYTVSRNGYHSLFGSFTVSGAGKTINTSALTQTGSNSAEWPAFRNDSNNMAIVSNPTAKGSWQIKEDWTTTLGALGTYGTLSTSNIVIYDNYLYVATEHGLSKIEQSTGKIVTSTPLSGNVSYVTQIAYGDGKIFVTNAKGIDAFDALTMKRVWSTVISAYGNYMATTPIQYDSATKTLYVGDYGDSNYTLGTYGGYSAISAVDGTSKWIYYGDATDARYWAGATIVGNYVVFGSNSGILTSVNKNTTDINGYGSLTAVANKLSVTGKINSSIAYDGTNLYFTTYSGYMYKVAINSSNGALSVSSSRQFATGSSSTPVVVDGKIYVGANDGIYVLKASDLSQVSHYDTHGAVQSSALVTKAYAGVNYAYFTVNSAKGEIVLLKDDGTNVSYETLYTPSNSQYSMVSLVSDGSGTLYYANDSGKLSALSNTNEDNTNKVKTTFEVTPASLFNSSTYTTSYPSIVVKDSGAHEVTTKAMGTYYLGAGTYTYSVSLGGYTTGTGSFTIGASDIASGNKSLAVTLSKSSSGGTTIDSTVNVTVKGYNNKKIVSGHSVTITDGQSAWDAIKKALDASGVEYVAKNTSMGVYISSVNGLAEFDKGANSGWEYTINGTQPNVGVSLYTLKSNDVIVLYYTADYTKEKGNISVGVSTTPAVTNLTEAIVNLKGVASVTLNGEALSNFSKNLTTQNDVEGAKATINLTAASEATGMNLTIPQATITALGNKINTALNLETSIGNLVFDPAAIDNITAMAGSNDVTFSITKLDNLNLSDANRALVGNHPVYDLSVNANGIKITDFGKGVVSVKIPYTPKVGEDTSKLTVYYIGEDGKVVKMPNVTFDKTSGCLIFTTNHFSKYAIVDETPKVEKSTSKEPITIKPRTFEDITETDWYYSAVQYVSLKGLMNGTGNNNFGPNQNMSREMFITVLYRMAGEPSVKGTNAYLDVKEGQYYSEAIKWARVNGIASGYSNGKFGINDNITREQMIAILYNYAKVRGYDVSGTVNLKNVSGLSNWAKSSVSWAIAEGLIKGGSTANIMPSENLTRAQAAMILMRFSQNCVK